jgi:hypothetical protein
MFSNWFSGDDLERYRTSAHKRRIDAIGHGRLIYETVCRVGAR